MPKNKHIVLSVIILALLIGAIMFISSDQRFSKRHSQAQAGKQIWYCPMHPWIKSDKPGVCPICGMALVPGHTHDQAAQASSIPGYAVVEITPEKQELAGIRTGIVDQKGKELIIPKEAMMDLGSQKIAFVEKEDNKFEPRDINALQKGDRIAVSGVFLLNSESQVQNG
jgi:hypothetical protein